MNETEEEMSEQDKTLARRWFEDLFSRGNLDAADEILSADFVDHLTHEDERGLEELKHYVTIYRTAFPDIQDTLEQIVAEGDKVVVRWTSRGTHQGEFMGVAPTDSVQGGDGLGQRLQSLHLPPVLGVVVEAISRAYRFASNVLGLRSEVRGDDLVKGGLGADFVKGSSSADKMYGGDGNDKMGGWTGDDIFFGGAANDRLSGGDGADEIHGQEGDDIDLDGDAAIDKIYGEEGNDFELDGDSGNDLIYGGAGDDGGAPTSENLQHHGLRGEDGENRVYGEDGADTIDAQTTLLSALVYCVHRGRFACFVDLAGAREEIFGGDGDDTITAADGVEDEIDCGLGLDRVVSYDRGLDVLLDCETR